MQRKKEVDNHSAQYIMRALRFGLPATQWAITSATYSEIGKKATHPNADCYLLLLLSLELIAFTITTVKASTAAWGLSLNGSRGFTRGQHAILSSLLLTSMLVATYFIATILENKDYNQDQYNFTGLMGGLSSLLNLSVECSATLFYANKHNLTFRDAFDEIEFEPECTIM